MIEVLNDSLLLTLGELRQQFDAEDAGGGLA
jgi:hypothetical protein